MLTPMAAQDNQQASSDPWMEHAPSPFRASSTPLPEQGHSLGQALLYRWPTIRWEVMQKALTTQSLGTAASLCPKKHSCRSGALEKHVSHLCDYHCGSCQVTQLDPDLPQCRSHLLVLYQEIGGDQAEGPHRPAVEAAGQDQLGGVKGHSTRHFLCSREVIQLREGDAPRAHSWMKLDQADTANNHPGSHLHHERVPQEKSELAWMDPKASAVLGLWAFG